MATFVFLPELSFELCDGVATGCVWAEVAGDGHWGRTLQFLEAADPCVAKIFSSPENTIVVDELAVDPEYRGRGAERECLAQAIGDRVETRVILGVFEQAEDARSMLARWRFGTVPRGFGMVPSRCTC